MYAGRYFPSIHDHRDDQWEMAAPAKLYRGPSPTTREACSARDARWKLPGPRSIADAGCWPNSGRLAPPVYRPLEVFSPPAVGPPTSWSDMDDLCGLFGRLREIELLTMMGERLDVPRYRFLRDIKFYKIKQKNRRN